MTFQLNQAAWRQFIQTANGPVGRDLVRRARAVETRARLLAPVDTGRMRSTVHVNGPFQSSSGIAYDVVAATDYAFYVHQGTRYMQGRPFLVDALPAATR